MSDLMADLRAAVAMADIHDGHLERNRGKVWVESDLADFRESGKRIAWDFVRLHGPKLLALLVAGKACRDWVEQYAADTLEPKAPECVRQYDEAVGS